MAEERRQPNTGVFWLHILREKLPPELAHKVLDVVRDVNRTDIVFRPTNHPNEVWYREIKLYEPWLSDEMIARIALEAP